MKRKIQILRVFRLESIVATHKFEENAASSIIGRWATLVLTLLFLALFILKVDLSPQVDPYFFFSGDDPQLAAERKIASLFPEESQVFISAKGDIRSEAYFQTVELMTEELAAVGGVFSVQSISRGPGKIETALKSPLWKRILIAEEGKASNFIVHMDIEPDQSTVLKVEEIKKRYDRPGFELVMSGVPYVNELVRRNLARDLKVFTLAAFLIFGIAILLVFRSLLLVAGTLLSCLSAALLTLLLGKLLGMRIGLLTANLATIVFVLTLTHILFLTFNWRHLVQKSGTNPVLAPFEGVRMTVDASFWSMLTTLLGFASLMLVEAVPLRRLGMAGMIGTTCSFLSAYFIYPWFIPRFRPKHLHVTEDDQEQEAGALRFFGKQHEGIMKIFGCACVVAFFGLWNVNTDPSLLSYFKEKSEIREGLAYIDRNIGSSPLSMVVEYPDHRKLNSGRAFESLWRLHQRLEEDVTVGSVVSLPLVVAEAKRSPFAFLLPGEWILGILELPQFGEVGKAFVTKDRQHTLFMLMMREEGRTESREVTVLRLQRIVEEFGFKAALTGNMFALQGRIARLLASSLISGVVLLLFLFTAMVRLLFRSTEITTGVFASLLVLPLWLLGVMGCLRIPFDAISSPAVNLAIGMGVDSMIHMCIWMRRHAQTGISCREAWITTAAQLWRPIMYTAVTVSAGGGLRCCIGILCLSNSCCNGIPKGRI